ncbi:sensor histidine kinase [Tenacibaculum sp. MEBiC06402]|uniref:sensor histidine kinase n=1 Tax=unclassified Tenacibaculum TaxID=2635139 RepID=UPI003B9D1C10
MIQILDKYKKIIISIIIISILIPLIYLSYIIIESKQDSVRVSIGLNSIFEIILLIFYILLLFIVFSYLISWFITKIQYVLNLKKEKAKTELQHLQSQVNPHFFFNMLNNLYGLVDSDREKAKRLILQLSDMMRYSIYEGQKELVTLEQEIDFIQSFLELHKMRYHKKIDINFNVDVQSLNLKLTPLLFIILVENAFKHGVEVLRDNAYVTINITEQNGTIKLHVENNFDTELKTENGIGLSNLKRRLELLYPKNHKFSKLIKEDVYTTQLLLMP